MSIRTKTKKYGHRSLGKEQFTFLPYTDHMCTPLYSFLKLSKTVPIVFITKLQLETQQVHTLLVQLPEEGRLQSMSIVKMTSINFVMEFFDFFIFFSMEILSSNQMVPASLFYFQLRIQNKIPLK